MGLFEEEKKTHHCLGQRVQLDFKYDSAQLGSVLFRLAQCVSLGAQCCSAAMQKSLRIRKIGKNPVKRRIDLFQQFRLEKLEKQYSTLNVQFLVIAVKALKK